MLSQAVAVDQLRILQAGPQSLTAESFARMEPLMAMPPGFEKQKRYSYPEHWKYLIAPVSGPKGGSR